MSKQLLPHAVLMTAFAIPVLAFQASAPDKGKQVIDACVQALGGQQFLNMRTRVASGRVYSFFHDQLSALDLATIYTEYTQGDSPSTLAVRERERLGKKQDYSYLYLADQGWDITYRGARPIPDETWERYLRVTHNDILYFLRARSKEAGLDFDYIGNQVYLSRHIEIVDITDSTNLTVRVYFDYNSKLPIRQTYTWLDPQTKERNEEVSVYDKWRDIGGGIMWPYSIERERNGYKTYQFFADRIQANADVPAKTFELPPGAKVLRKVN